MARPPVTTTTTTTTARTTTTVFEARTVGVVERVPGAVCPGYTLFSAGRCTYLVDLDGSVVREWPSDRNVFASYLLAGGRLLRDGSDSVLAPHFATGGAAGYLECVSWFNEVVWAWSAEPRSTFLTHHDLEPLGGGDGSCLVLCWERVPREEALAAGRQPDLLPDGEVWNNLVLEVKPDEATKTATVVWRWSQWDHLCQDHDSKRANYVPDVSSRRDLFDVNFAPPGGKEGSRTGGLTNDPPHPSGLALFKGPHPGRTGEKDWLHANSVAFCPDRDLVVVSYNVPSEVIIVDHGTTAAEAAAATGGRRGQGGSILFRFGNPQTWNRTSRFEQALYCQHSVHFVREAPSSDTRFRLVCFNNGRAPDRLWSTVDEFDCDLETGKASLAWRLGPSVGKRNSFYATHMSAVHRCANGNTLVTLGPQGILFEVTPAHEEVWRFISPVEVRPVATEGRAHVPQGRHRTRGKFGLFFARRYHPNDPALAGRDLAPLYPIAPTGMMVH